VNALTRCQILQNAKFGNLILKKIIKLHKFSFGYGFALDPAGGLKALSRPHLLDLGVLLLREGRGKEGGKEREGKRRAW